MPSSRASPNHWTLKQLEERRVRYDELVPCRNAFIDTRNPGSEDKRNSTIVGPGVSGDLEQHDHISEPHGFNIGAARQPRHCINSQHSHGTAEVFVVHSGEWTLNFGEQGELKLPAGRGVRADAGPAESDLMPRTTAAEVAALASPSSEELSKCIIAGEEMTAQPAGLFVGEGVDERLLIGPGARIDWPHGFTLSRVTITANSTISAYVHDQKEVWFVHDGALDCVASAGEVQLSTGDTMSLPEHLHRGWKACSHTIASVVRGGNVLPPLVRA